MASQYSFRDFLAIAVVKSRRDCQQKCIALEQKCSELQAILQRGDEERKVLENSLADLKQRYAKVQMECLSFRLSGNSPASTNFLDKARNLADEPSKINSPTSLGSRLSLAPLSGGIFATSLCQGERSHVDDTELRDSATIAKYSSLDWKSILNPNAELIEGVIQHISVLYYR